MLSAAKPGIGRSRAKSIRMRRGELESRILILVTLALVAFGIVCVYSATSAPAAVGGGNPNYYVERQGMYAVLGIVLMVVGDALELPPAARARAGARARLARPPARRARDRARRERRAALDLARAGRLPAVGAREARARGLGGGLPLAPPAAAHAPAARAPGRAARRASTRCCSSPSPTSARRSRCC